MMKLLVRRCGMRLAAGLLFLTTVFGSAARARAGAVEQSCMLEKVEVGALTFELKQPKQCPPGDLLVRGPGLGRPLTLPRALYIAGFGKTRLPAVVDDWIVWLQADGDRSLLRVTRITTGESFTLGRGGFVPGQVVRSGTYLAIGESRDPLPADIRMAIPRRMVVVDLKAKDHPARLADDKQPRWSGEDLALERIYELTEPPGSFWFLLPGLSPTRPPFRVGRWQDGVTQLAVFDRPDYGSYAYIAIDPGCGLVAWNACDAVHDRAQGCKLLFRGITPGHDATLALPSDGYVGRLQALSPDSLGYTWVSQSTYAEEKRIQKFKARCQP